MSNKVVDWSKPIEGVDGQPAVVTSFPDYKSRAIFADCWDVSIGETERRTVDMFGRSALDGEPLVRNVEPQEPPLCEHTLRRVLEVLPANPVGIATTEFDEGADYAVERCRKRVEELMPKSPLTAILSAITREDESMPSDYAEGFHEALRRLHDKGLLREVGE